MMVAPPSILYTVSNVLFHKYVGENVAFTICMSHFSMFPPTKATVKVANQNMVHVQVIGIILCFFTNCSIIYRVGPVYYYPGHPYNTITSGSLNFFVGFKKVSSEPLEHFDFVDPQGRPWRSPYQNQNNIDYLQIDIFKVNPQGYSNTVFQIFCLL